MRDLINNTVFLLEVMKKNVKKYKTDKQLLEIINKFINKKIKPNTTTKSLKGKGKKCKGKKCKGKQSKKGTGLKFFDPSGIGPNTIHEDEEWKPSGYKSENSNSNSNNSYNSINSYKAIYPKRIGTRQQNDLDRKLAKESYQSHHYILLLICIYYVTTGETINAVIYLFAHNYLMNI